MTKPAHAWPEKAAFSKWKVKGVRKNRTSGEITVSLRYNCGTLLTVAILGRGRPSDGIRSCSLWALHELRRLLPARASRSVEPLRCEGTGQGFLWRRSAPAGQTLGALIRGPAALLERGGTARAHLPPDGVTVGETAARGPGTLGGDGAGGSLVGVRVCATGVVTWDATCRAEHSWHLSTTPSEWNSWGFEPDLGFRLQRHPQRWGLEAPQIWALGAQQKRKSMKQRCR
jgi:hypothetical protein